jgi:hypothetical protein
MADQPVPDLPDDTNENVPRVLGVRANNSLALTPGGLPLTGGTLTGTLFLEGTSKSKIANDGGAGRERFSLFGSTSVTTGAALRLYGDGDSTTSAGRVQFLTGGEERMRITQAGRVTVHGDLQVDGVIIGQGLFHIEEGTDTADVVDGVTVNTAITALLNEVRTLTARIATLEES